MKGGVVFADSEYNRWNPVFGSATATDTRTGWLVGVGIEYAFHPNWSAKIEYNYMDFGTQTETFMFNTSPCCLTVHSDVEQKVQSLKPV